ncbi:hypothetical protein BRADO6129 [Bradyrhizobium sp. ORS 278]|uniref:hypothetical protein n=1 Tax=Bradyrhizobium sp. (strain ORS 278) TaxID=114615 RepID=UPI00015086EF|nr:hypothetical protein [Bradyrhizobium sp. ORS 278]CAL79780.1 hypothetical protein BRADO6129 [Bradyrhizobium sp. ORS 278]
MPKATISDEYESVLSTFDAIARKDYGQSFRKILEDADNRRRLRRFRHILGVSMKMDFSLVVPHKAGEVPHRWIIDPPLLAKKSSKDWQIRVLTVYPDRRPGESGKDVALRLKRETFLARAFVKSVHQYICDDAETRKKVKDILTEIGLKEAADIATPKGMIKVGAGSLLAYLGPPLGAIPATGVAVAVVVLLVLGLDAVCAASKDSK